MTNKALKTQNNMPTTRIKIAIKESESRLHADLLEYNCHCNIRVDIYTIIIIYCYRRV
jgi:hypothetical protein